MDVSPNSSCLFIFPKFLHNKIQCWRKKHTKTTINVVLLCFGVPLVTKKSSQQKQGPFVEKWRFARWHLPAPKLRGEREGCMDGHGSQMGFLGVQHDAGPMCVFLFFPDKNFPWICLVEGLWLYLLKVVTKYAGMNFWMVIGWIHKFGEIYVCHFLSESQEAVPLVAECYTVPDPDESN